MRAHDDDRQFGKPSRQARSVTTKSSQFLCAFGERRTLQPHAQRSFDQPARARAYIVKDDLLLCRQVGFVKNGRT